MKLKINNKYFKWGVTAFSVIAASLCFYYLVFHISEIIQNIKSLLNIIMPVIFGLIIAYLLTPILNFIEKRILNPLCDSLKIKETVRRKRWVRAVAVVLTSCLLILLLYALIAMLVSQIVPSIQNIINNFDSYVINLSAWLNKLLEDNQDLKNFVIPQVNRLSLDLEKWLTDTATLIAKSGEVLKTVSLSILSFLKVAWNFIIGFIISIYVLASKETFSAQGKKMIYAIFENDTANSVLSSLRFVHRTFIGFISGKVLDSLIIGLLCFIGTTLMNTPYAALVSVIVGVTNIIPFFGPYLGAIPSAFLILIVDLAHPMNCISFIIFIIILQQVDGNLIGPKILGESTGLSGFWVIFAITVFGGLFGILGMIVGVPIFAIFYAAVKGLVNRSLKKKSMPLNTETYLNVDSVNENGEFIEVEEECSNQRIQNKHKDKNGLFHKIANHRPHSASKKTTNAETDHTINEETSADSILKEDTSKINDK
ncbi:MAG: AI-2E family transporter [Lachnospiraceae bacterium]